MNRFEDADMTTPGFALVGVMLIAALLGLAVVPLVSMVGDSQTNSFRQRISSLVTVEAREILELGVMLTKTAGGVPENYTDLATLAPTSTQRILANQCQTRMAAITDNDPRFMLSPATPHLVEVSPVLSRVTTRNGAIFVKEFAVTPGDITTELMVVACVVDGNNALQVFSSELLLTRGTLYTRNLREF